MSLYNNPQDIVLEIHWFFLSPKSADFYSLMHPPSFEKEKNFHLFHKWDGSMFLNSMFFDCEPWQHSPRSSFVVFDAHLLLWEMFVDL